MIRAVFIVVVLIHGLIHLMGFAKAFGYAELPQLAQPISRPLGIVWLLAALLLAATAASLAVWPRVWWIIAAVALTASQVVIVSSWSDARFGTLLNAVLLIGIVYGFASAGPLSLKAEYRQALEQFRTPEKVGVLTEADIASLPDPVQRYIRHSGAVGQPRIRNVRATWTGRIRSDAASPWMLFTAEQFNTIDSPRRFFLMDASMKGLPVDVLHAFDDRGATMRVRVLSVYPMVNAKGEGLTRAETVTLFNDICVVAPGALISPLIAWEPVDARTVKARFTLRANTVSAELFFNERDELVDFISDDRSASSSDGGTLTAVRWSTPLSKYAAMGPVLVATRGDVVWHPVTGTFAYGEFELTSLAYNVEP